MKTTLLVEEGSDPFCGYNDYLYYQNWHNPTPTGRWYIQDDNLYLEILFTKQKGWFTKKKQATKFVVEWKIKLVVQGDIQTCSTKSQT